MKWLYDVLRGVAMMVVAVALVACNGDEARMGILKVYNWGDYIDEELIPEFEEWYFEQTGEEVEVIYQTFDINEVMLAKIENGQADFDVVCPSEYIIERMLRNEMVLPILTPEFEAEMAERDINYFGCVSPYIKEQFSLLEAPEGVNPNEYAVGYMWGTTGILYNTALVNKEEILSLGGLQNEKFAGKVFMKDAFRDIYSVVVLYAYRDEIARGEVSKDELDKSDVVIGPVSTAELKRILEMDPKAVVSPLDQKAAVLAETFSDMIQAPVPLDIQYKDLIQWIDEDMQYSDRFIVISEKGGIPTDATLQMKAAADSSGLEFKHLEYSILEGRDISSSLEYIMTESGSNRVYIASDSEAFVNDVVRNLNLMVYNKYQVVLYAPSRIRNYETIEVEHFHNTSLHISAGYYIDYNDPRVQEFLLKYRALYNTEPTQFAFQGYDLATYFIDLVSRYGENWSEMMPENEKKMLQSTFRFRKAGNEGGYINNGVKRISYEEGWKVKEQN